MNVRLRIRLLRTRRRIGLIHGECPVRSLALIEPNLEFSIDHQNGTLGASHTSGDITDADVRVRQ
jgi:hypothetical protein